MAIDTQCYNLKSHWSLFKRFSIMVMQRFIDHGCAMSAAALTYTTLFAVVPLMTLVYSILSLVPELHSANDIVQNFIFNNFVPSTGEVVQEYLNNFSQQARKLTGIGIGFLIVTSFLMLKTVDKTINDIWQVTHVRTGVSGFLLYWAVLSLGPIFISAGLLLTSYVASLKLVSDTTALFFDAQSGWVLTLVPVVISTLALTLLYIAIPNRKVLFRHALGGALVAALLIELAKAAFSFFIFISPTYYLIYDAFAAVPLFLLWVYLSWLLILFGAVLVRSFDFWHSTKNIDSIHPTIVLLLILRQMQNRFFDGNELGIRDFKQLDLAVALEDIALGVEQLVVMNMVQKNAEGNWLLAKDLRNISLYEFCEQLPWQMPSNLQLEMIATNYQCHWLNELIHRIQQVNQARQSLLDCSLDSLFNKK